MQWGHAEYRRRIPNKGSVEGTERPSALDVCKIESVHMYIFLSALAFYLEFLISSSSTRLIIMVYR